MNLGKRGVVLGEVYLHLCRPANADFDRDNTTCLFVHLAGYGRNLPDAQSGPPAATAALLKFWRRSRDAQFNDRFRVVEANEWPVWGIVTSDRSWPGAEVDPVTANGHFRCVGACQARSLDGAD